MIFSEDCFICKGKMIPSSYGAGLNPAGIFKCQKGCTSYQIRNGVKYIFHLNIVDSNIEVIFKHNPFRFDFHIIDADIPMDILGDPVIHILANDISIDNTYDLSEHFCSLAAQINKVKAFI